ncbi:MAG: hypothetical protein PHO19_00710, partial [Candidatus Pacebacteria bacterium]|nr:hypothetical protein [Candidatus Paceibacterota bacterium]
TPTNGQCGSSDGGSFTGAPTANLCSSGNASSVSGNGPWDWTCYGKNGGSNAYCSAYKTQQTNNNPTVNAGPNKEIEAGQSMYIYATASDPDGDYLTYSWSCTGGS